MSRLTDNLISRWELDEASGSAVDGWGSNTLTETSGTIDPFAGGGRDFELGDSEWFEIASNASLVTGDIDFTIAAWVRAESLPASVMEIACKQTSSGVGGEWLLGWDGSSRFRFLVRNLADAANVSRNFTTLGLPVINTWYFLVAWHDSVANTLNAQANDGAVDSTAHSAGVFAGTAKFLLGNRDGGTNYWDGVIRRVGFWKRVLTANERTWLYNGGVGRTIQEIRIKRSILALPSTRSR